MSTDGPPYTSNKHLRGLMSEYFKARLTLIVELNYNI